MVLQFFQFKCFLHEGDFPNGMGESEDDDNDDDDAVENEGSEDDDDDDVQALNSRKRNKLPATDFEQEDRGHSDNEKNGNFLGDELENNDNADSDDNDNYDGDDYDDDDDDDGDGDEEEEEGEGEELEDDEGSDAIQNFSATSLSEDIEKGKAARNQLSKWCFTATFILKKF